MLKVVPCLSQPYCSSQQDVYNESIQVESLKPNLALSENKIVLNAFSHSKRK